MYESLYQLISQAVCLIVVDDDEGNRVGEGSGFAFTPTGEVITAAHVISGHFRDADFRDPSLIIKVAFPGRDPVTMRPRAWGPTVNVPMFRAPFMIDFAVLAPASDLKLSHFLPVAYNRAAIGKEVFLAGYPDDLCVPFDVTRKLRSDANGAHEYFKAMRNGHLTNMTGPMIRRAVIGNLRRVFASGEHRVEVDSFYVDNDMHHGSSGGPVVDRQGAAIGLIVERATTVAQQDDATKTKIRIPSGATLALSLDPLEALRKMLGSAGT